MHDPRPSLTSRAVPIPAPAAPARLAVEVRRDLDLTPNDVRAWDELIEARPEVGVFVSKPWLSGFFEEPPPDTVPMLVLLRAAGVLCGVAPIAVRRRVTHARIALLGGGLGSDRVDLLSAKGFEVPCSDALLTWLGDAFGRGFVLELQDVPIDSALWGAIYRANATGSVRLALQPRDVHALPCLDLAELWPASLEDQSPMGGGSLDRHRRWLERRGHVRVDVLNDVREVMDSFDALARLLHARWAHTPCGSALDQPATRRFHRHVLPLLLRARRLKMVRLSVDARIVAVFYGLTGASWWGYYFLGYDREWAGRLHLGRLALAEAIRLATQDGATEFDFLKGPEPVKYLWPVRTRATLSAEVYAAGAGAQLARAVAATRDAAAAVAKFAGRLAAAGARA